MYKTFIRIEQNTIVCQRICALMCVWVCARALILYLDSFCSVFLLLPFSFKTFLRCVICKLNKTAHVLLLLLLLLNINLNFKYCSKFLFVHLLFCNIFNVYFWCSYKILLLHNIFAYFLSLPLSSFYHYLFVCDSIE